MVTSLCSPSPKDRGFLLPPLVLSGTGLRGGVTNVSFTKRVLTRSLYLMVAFNSYICDCIFSNVSECTKQIRPCEMKFVVTIQVWVSVRRYNYTKILG